NPTSLPLFLDCVTTTADSTGSTTPISTFLVPNHPYDLQIIPILNAENRGRYDEKGLVLNVEVSVFFTDWFENKWKQRFTALIWCARTDNYLEVQESRTTMRRIDGKEGQKA